VLLFIDNIFRFTQAGSEVSALLGRMPSAVGYQPNLASEMGELFGDPLLASAAMDRLLHDAHVLILEANHDVKMLQDDTRRPWATKQRILSRHGHLSNDAAAQLAELPAGAVAASLGCGNPTALIDLHEGQTVLDLGSGGGIDVLLSARRVGPTGRAIGLDMTDEMLALARRNAAEAGVANVEFVKGELEDMPLPAGSVDVVISNCVVNLAPDKRAVFGDVLRVLKPGGRLAISDVVALRELPAAVVDDLAARCGCISGAARIDELTALLRELGFGDVRVELEPQSREIIAGWGGGFEDLVASARITATKPGGACCAPGCCA